MFKRLRTAAADNGAKQGAVETDFPVQRTASCVPSLPETAWLNPPDTSKSQVRAQLEPYSLFQTCNPAVQSRLRHTAGRRPLSYASSEGRRGVIGASGSWKCDWDGMVGAGGRGEARRGRVKADGWAGVPRADGFR
ncbi:hypothetical protein SKAU_G00300580 [Synaphobranchus kaupii]|uniref:Uncharacterized protein n=1 Tax=Synaphobranchus kaupii TaxID=118154 RepID=A0A9Q1IL38_SYNKA|nr:hypothetical protein SKAU_G00300580 [Synaphobranchus kaupii]